MKSPAVISESDIRNAIREAYAAGANGDEDVAYTIMRALQEKLRPAIRRIHREFQTTEAN